MNAGASVDEPVSGASRALMRVRVPPLLDCSIAAARALEDLPLFAELEQEVDDESR